MKTSMTTIAVLALGAVLAAYAQEPAAEGEEAAEGVGTAEKPADSAKTFHTLPRVLTVTGNGEVMYAVEGGGWSPIEPGRHYPLGCAFRTIGADSRIRLELGVGCVAELGGDSAIGTMAQKLGGKTRTLVLKDGTFKFLLPRNMPPETLLVTAPGFTVRDLSGESEFAFANTGDGDRATIKCITGTMSIVGRHFCIKKMSSADDITIRTSQDMLFTGIYGNSGDCKVTLEQGIIAVNDVVSGETHDETRTLDWSLTPRTAVRIHRAKPSVGERMSVTVMTFDAAGGVINRCAFAEGRPEVNSGEIGDGAVANNEENAKKAMGGNADAAVIEDVKVEDAPVATTAEDGAATDATDTEETTTEEESTEEE